VPQNTKLSNHKVLWLTTNFMVHHFWGFVQSFCAKNDPMPHTSACPQLPCHGVNRKVCMNATHLCRVLNDRVAASPTRHGKQNTKQKNTKHKFYAVGDGNYSTHWPVPVKPNCVLCGHILAKVLHNLIPVM
jgi:hypothetical protein